jgi:hypothetical protein
MNNMLRGESRIAAWVGILAVLLAVAIPFSLHAQTNIALVSTPCICTHSGGGSGYPSGYGPEQYNDGVNPTPNGYFGWTTTSANPDPNAWIQFDWGTTSRSPGEITLYYVGTGNRYLQGGNVQYWNGSTWVTQATFSFTNTNLTTQVITFTPVTTTKIRLQNLNVIGSQSSNPNFHEIEVRETIQGVNNAGVTAITSPLNFCAGTYPITVNLTNAGTNAITSCTIKWTLNGVPQPDYAWTGLLDITNSVTRNTLVTLNPGYNFLSGVPYTIKAWSYMPNGLPDAYNANDETLVTRQAAISGTFTIGGASPNYPNFTAAVAALNANGVCGPVVFNVRSGTYTEQVNINAIVGASATNTITFQSESGNRNDVTLQYSATTTGTGSATVCFTGTKYVTFQNMSIFSTGASYGYTLYYQSGCQYDKILNCWVKTSGTSSSSFAPVYSPSGSQHNYCEFRNSTFENGYYGFYWYGSSTTALSTQTVIDNCIILNWYYYGILSYYQDANQFTRNTIQTNSTSAYYGIYGYYNQNGRNISGNKLIFLGTGYHYGLMLYYNQATTTAPGLTSNNFVTIPTTHTGYYPLYLYYGDNQMVYNNSFYNGCPSTYYGAYIYYGSNIKSLNNMYYCPGPSYAVYVYPGTNIINSNYNLYYSTGSSLAYWNAAYANLAALQAANGMDKQSISKTVNFVDPLNGNLHLTGSSQDDPALQGTMLPEVTVDIDGEPRARPYIGADEGCYITQGSVYFDIVDANGTPKTYFNYPGTLYCQYYIGFPATAFTTTITLNFYTVPANTLAYTTTFNVTKIAGVAATGIQAISMPTMPSGYYRVEGVFLTNNSCNLQTTYRPGDKSALALGSGQTPCIVYPGDVTNNGVVDYGDRSGLNKYLQLANLNPLWINGPARYRADYATNPFTYYTWVGQASAPWNTPEGCYMDADGNGMVNGMDYIAMKLNWLRTWSATPKSAGTLTPGTFDMAQNYPNPFNPMTSISYSAPERSQVRLVVTDMLGREVATLVNGSVEAGSHTAIFDGASLNSGRYMATITMTGESGLSFSKTVKMTLAK